MTECQGKMSFVTEHCSLGSLDTLHHKIDLSEENAFGGSCSIRVGAWSTCTKSALYSGTSRAETYS